MLHVLSWEYRFPLRFIYVAIFIIFFSHFCFFFSLPLHHFPWFAWLVDVMVQLRMFWRILRCTGLRQTQRLTGTRRKTRFTKCSNLTEITQSVSFLTFRNLGESINRLLGVNQEFAWYRGHCINQWIDCLKMAFLKLHRGLLRFHSTPLQTDNNLYLQHSIWF